VLERAFPLRVLRYRLRRGSAGAGYSPGGEGIERDLQVLEDCTVSLITERRVSRPWGLEGGGDGAPGENWLLPAGDETQAERLPTSAPSASSRATSSACSPPAAAGDPRTITDRRSWARCLDPLQTTIPEAWLRSAQNTGSPCDRWRSGVGGRLRCKPSRAAWSVPVSSALDEPVDVVDW